MSTELATLGRGCFWWVEAPLLQVRGRPYCMGVVAPKVAKVRAKYATRLRG